MRSIFGRIGLSALFAAIAAMLFLAAGSPAALAQGGEPQYFAIRDVKVVPVSGPPIEDATIVVALERR